MYSPLSVSFHFSFFIIVANFIKEYFNIVCYLRLCSVDLLVSVAVTKTCFYFGTPFPETVAVATR